MGRTDEGAKRPVVNIYKAAATPNASKTDW